VKQRLFDLGALAMAGLALLVAPASALAHAVPVATAPEPYAVVRDAPSEIAIRYSERVEGRASSLEVFDARGFRVVTEAPAVPAADPWLFRMTLPTLTSGIYTVSWRVTSADDGHVTTGAHVFVVGAVGTAALPRPAPVMATRSWMEVGGRWANTLGEVAILGLLTAPLVLRSTATPQMPARQLVLASAGVAMLGAAVAGAAKAAQIAPGRSAWVELSVLMSTALGRVWAAKIAVLVLLATTVVMAYRATGKWRRSLWALAILLALLTLLAGSVVSHSAAVVESRPLAIAAQMTHLLAIALWVGGLGYFATVFWHARGGDLALAAAASAIPAFSVLATVALGALTVTGVYLARLHLGSADELISTPYGRTLTAKLGIVAVMLGLGGYHQFFVHRRVLAALAQPQLVPTLGRRLRRTLKLEALLGAVALLLAGVLGTTTPPHVATAGDAEVFRQDRDLEDARLVTEVWPLRPGLNTIRVTVSDRRGQPLGTTTSALLRLRATEADAAPIVIALDRESPGTFSRTGPLLGLPGRWLGQLVVQRTEAYDLHDRLELAVREPSGHHAHETRAAPLDVPMGLTAAGIAAAAGVLALRSRRTLRRALQLTTARARTSDASPGEIRRCGRS
jgi:copper transport protein